MFKKPFRVKSNTAIKGSERRKLRENVSKLYLDLSGEELLQLIPNKEEISVLKIYTHNGINVTCYCLRKNPIFFNINDLLLPTVYLLWTKSMGMLSFETPPNVFPILAGGADLMLRGVVPAIDENFPDFDVNTPSYVKLTRNSAAVAVGVTTCSKQSVLNEGAQGKRVTIYHCYQDYLWSLGDKSMLPLIEDHIVTIEDTKIILESVEQSIDGDMKTDTSPIEDVEDNTQVVHSNDILTNEKQDDDDDGVESTSPQEKIDLLLKNCFCQAILNSKKIDLPILVSKFSSQYLHPACPDGEWLDVKKSSFKKMSKFLSAMQSEGVIQVKELSKGVESITQISLDNELIHNYRRSDFAQVQKKLREIKLDEEKEELKKNNQVVEIREVYAVSAKTASFFRLFQVKKGDTLSSSDVRKFITEYIKDNELVDQDNKKNVRLDPLLTDCLFGKGGHEEVLTRDVLINKFLQSLNPCHEITIPGQKPLVKKGKMEFIEVNIEQRMGNKKVTVVKNLESFGIDVKSFAQELQQQAASSTTVNPVPGKNSAKELVLVQGVQTKHIKTVLEHFKIPTKYIKGLDGKDRKK